MAVRINDWGVWVKRSPLGDGCLAGAGADGLQPATTADSLHPCSEAYWVVAVQALPLVACSCRSPVRIKDGELDIDVVPLAANVHQWDFI
jgi:hypothetical protein